MPKKGAKDTKDKSRSVIKIHRTTNAPKKRKITAWCQVFMETLIR